MNNKNSIRLEHIMLSMAATVSNDESNKYKKHVRKKDCYSYICDVIKKHYDNDEINNCEIVIYSLASQLGHCVLKDQFNNIVADDFRKNRTSYDPITEEVSYLDLKVGSFEMGRSYKLDENSFRIKVSDFKLFFIKNLDLLIERSNHLKKEEISGVGDIIKDINSNISFNSIEKKYLNIENKKYKHKI